MTGVSRALQSKVAKTYLDGTHRILHPVNTVDRLLPMTSTFGITRVANVTGLDWLGIPVVTVCRPNSRSLSVSQGKGLTLDAAKASGLMEAIELYFAERITLPLIAGSVSDLKGTHNLVDVNKLSLVNRYYWHQYKQLLWLEGYDLLQGSRVWVPYDYVSVNATRSNLSGDACFFPTSNGLASGNHLLEAILHGICEVVERDGTTLWYKSDRATQAATRLAVDSCTDPDSARLIIQIHEAGLELLIWETTTDVGIPAFLCLLYETGENPERLKYTSAGMGCHLSSGIALIRAIIEAAQCRLTLISGSRDDVFRNEYEASRFRSDDLMRYCSLRPAHEGYRQFTRIPSYDHTMLNDDIECALQKLQSAGIDQVIAVPLTDPDCEYQIVKMIIPGLEGPDDHPGYSPGARVQRLRASRL